MGFYEKILEAVRGSERSPGKSEEDSESAREVLPFALQEFDAETADFLQRMMLKDLCYIPQEALDSCRGSRGGKYYKENQK